MAYETSGTLKTDVREVAISETWDTQTEWEAYQSKSNVTITNGILELAQIPLIDDFEDGDLSEYGGDTGTVTVQQSVVYNGNYALESPVGDGDLMVTDTNDLTHPSQGDTFSARFRHNQSTTNYHGLTFAQQEETATRLGYGVVLSGSSANSSFSIYLYDGGFNQLASSNVSPNTGEWYKYEITWATNGDITAALYDQSGSKVTAISATDTTYTSGGIGWYASGTSSGDTVYTDYGRFE